LATPGASCAGARWIGGGMAWGGGRQWRGKHSAMRQGRTRHAPGTSTSLSTGAQARSPHCITRACAAHAPQRRQTPPTKREAHTLSNGACGPAPGPSLYHPPSAQVARLRAEEKGCPSRSQVICIGIGRAAGWAGPRPRKSRELLPALQLAIHLMLPASPLQPHLRGHTLPSNQPAGTATS